MKKINSEIKIDNNTFKIKIGTVDKKNPTTLYIAIGTYITPIETNDDFSWSVIKMKKKIECAINDIISNSDDIQNNHIFIADVPIDRIMFNKQSYFETSLYIKPKKNTIEQYDSNFMQIANRINSIYLPKFISVLKNELYGFGYSFSKNKKV